MAVMEKYFITCLSSSVLKLLCAIDAVDFCTYCYNTVDNNKEYILHFWKPEDGD